MTLYKKLPKRLLLLCCIVFTTTQISLTQTPTPPPPPEPPTEEITLIWDSTSLIIIIPNAPALPILLNSLLLLVADAPMGYIEYLRNYPDLKTTTATLIDKVTGPLCIYFHVGDPNPPPFCRNVSDDGSGYIPIDILENSIFWTDPLAPSNLKNIEVYNDQTLIETCNAASQSFGCPVAWPVVGDMELVTDGDERFYIDRTETTRDAYDLFIQAGGYSNPDYWSNNGWEWVQGEGRQGPMESAGNPDDGNHPRAGLAGYEADAYCRWRARITGQQIRLPTTTEWQLAARGGADDGRRFPWGDSPPEGRANYDEFGNPGDTQTKPVGTYPAEGILLVDMIGNVAEWSLDPGTMEPNTLMGGSYLSREDELGIDNLDPRDPGDPLFILDAGVRCILELG